MSSLRWRKTTLTASVLFGIVAASVGQDFLYHVTPLGKLPGATGGRARDISDSGYVAGSSFTPGPINQAWRWDPINGLISLGQLPGGLDVSNSEAVNELGWVVGVARSENGTEAFLWTPEEGMQGLGDLPKGGFYSWSRGINNHNEITGVGTIKLAGHETKHQEAFLWNDEDGMWSLGEWPGGQEISVAVDINDATQVIGWSVRAAWDEPFLWDAVNGMRPIHDLPGGAKLADAVAINNLGQVAGLTLHEGVFQACTWSEEDGLNPLGTLGGKRPSSFAEDLNERGEVIGFSSPDDFGRALAFVWDRQRGMRAIEDLLDVSRGQNYFKLHAFAINNHGQIVGFSIINAEPVLLTPFVLGDMNCDGSVDNADVEGFLLTLLDFEEYQKRYPDCRGDWAADANQDGSADLQDIEAFVELLLN